MLMVTMSVGSIWKISAQMFRIKKNSIEIKIVAFGKFIAPHMEKLFIINVDAFVPKCKIMPLKHFPYAIYATDVMFQQ